MFMPGTKYLVPNCKQIKQGKDHHKRIHFFLMCWKKHSSLSKTWKFHPTFWHMDISKQRRQVFIKTTLGDMGRMSFLLCFCGNLNEILCEFCGHCICFASRFMTKSCVFVGPHNISIKFLHGEEKRGPRKETLFQILKTICIL